MSQNPFPVKLAVSALRALQSSKITKLEQLTKYSESALLELHGMGPNAIEKLRGALKEKGLGFKK